MFMIAGVTTFEGAVTFAVGFLAALLGALAYEPLRASWAAFRAKRAPLRQWYWQITYRAGDTSWLQLWSIELVQVHSRDGRVWGTMYRIYPSRYQRRWAFEGRLQGERGLSLIYRSIGEDYGSNGTVTLGVLSRWLWCGAFQQIPDIERGVQLKHRRERRQTRRVGPDFTEETLIEWLAADEDADDPVRGFLASIPRDSPAAPRQAAEHLPRQPRQVLLEPPPYPSWLQKGLETLAAPFSLDPMYAAHRLRRTLRPSPRPWESPSRKALGFDREDKAA